jgi:hypothetical protein
MLRRMAIREGYAEKMTVTETAISIWTTSRKIKMQRWIAMCDLWKDDPRYKDDLMETWYHMTPMQYAYEIVEGNRCQLEELWVRRIGARKDISSGTEGSTTS